MKVKIDQITYPGLWVLDCLDESGFVGHVLFILFSDLQSDNSEDLLLLG
jgi:hypothetical protein